jgi:hypothetical protein
MSNVRILQDVTVSNSITASGDLYVANNAMVGNLAIGVVGSVTNPDSTKALYVSGDTYISGTLTVAGSSFLVNTTFTTTSALSVVNNGTGPAIVGVQVGNEAIAAFYDDTDIALWVDGNPARPGFVGVGTKEPNKELTIIGDVSATGRIFGDGMLNKFISSFGNDSDTIYNIAHNLNVQDVVTTVIDNLNFEVVYPLVINSNYNEVTIEFSDPPGVDNYKIIIVG